MTRDLLHWLMQPLNWEPVLPSDPNWRWISYAPLTFERRESERMDPVGEPGARRSAADRAQKHMA